MTEFIKKNNKDIDYITIKNKIETEYQDKKYNYNWENVRKAFNQHYGNKKPFKHFFIDEAQDIPDELLLLIYDFSDNIYIFFDENQKIEEKGCNNILSLKDWEEQFYDLIVNFRNTKEIERVIRLYDNSLTSNSITLKPVTAKSNGEKPVLLDIKNDIDGLINMIIDLYQKDPSQSIALLIPKFINDDYDYEGKEVFKLYKNKLMNYLSKSSIPNFTYFGGDDSFKTDKMIEKGIYILSYKTAKGLEFDKVFLIELNNPKLLYDTETDRKGFYVAMSRAKDHLYFVFDGNENDGPIIKVAKNNKELFEHKLLKKSLDFLN